MKGHTKREWYAIKIEEDKIIIKTDIIDDLAINENIQIVSINDIERKETNMLLTNGIIFAPVIKVVNGNDNSDDVVEPLICIEKTKKKREGRCGKRRDEFNSRISA